MGAARLFAFHRKGGGGVYSTETRVALVKERQRQMRVYAAALALAALAAGIALGAVLRSGTKTKEEMT